MLFWSRRAYLRLIPVLVCTSIFSFLLGAEIAAQETYVHLANRLNELPPNGVTFSPSLEVGLLKAVNAYRRSQGVNALQPADGPLHRAARAQAMDLLGQGRVGHTASNGFGFESRMRAIHNGQLLPVMAENAVRSTRNGLSDPEIVGYLMHQWRNSPPHRKAMLSRDFVSVATGVARRGHVVYAVQVFSGSPVKTNIHIGQPTSEAKPAEGIY